MEAPFNSSFSFLAFFFIQILVLSRTNAEEPIGFSLDVVHRDSPQSPLYNPSINNSQRFADALKRSISRAARFEAISNPKVDQIQAQISAIVGEYLMKLSVGTPPFEIQVIADTGSDVTWTQCKPCTNCFKQIAPLFNPLNSSSYKNVSCQSKTCSLLAAHSCDNRRNCLYALLYGDFSFSNGNLATETFTFRLASRGPAAQVPNVVFGCGHDEEGTFNRTATGIVGLGGGKLSLISQLSESTENSPTA